MVKTVVPCGFFALMLKDWKYGNFIMIKIDGGGGGGGQVSQLIKDSCRSNGPCPCAYSLVN